MSHHGKTRIHYYYTQATAPQNFDNNDDCTAKENENTQHKASKLNDEQATAQPKKTDTKETNQKGQSDAKKIAEALRQFCDKSKIATCAYCKIRGHDVLVYCGLKYDYEKGLIGRNRERYNQNNSYPPKREETNGENFYNRNEDDTRCDKPQERVNQRPRNQN